MICTLKLLLKTCLKKVRYQGSRSRKEVDLAPKNGGFTLIELLVGLIIASIVITPIMSFMINILDTSRREEAKASSEQEVESALNYIAQDLNQAIYIYNSTGLDNSNLNTNPGISGIKDQIPPAASAPGCINNPPNDVCVPVLVFWKRDFREVTVPIGVGSIENNTLDTFVYSLVGYYLIKGNDPNNTWSNAARIGRFQITDGVKNTNNSNNINGISYLLNPSSGFRLFDLRIPGTTLEEKMNNWRKTEERYTTTVDTLVDYIDPSNLTPNCPTTTTQTNIQQVPSTLVGGFAACVDSSNTSAQIYIRGNAVARISDGTNCDRELTYCPTASIQVQGRGLLNAD